MPIGGNLVFGLHNGERGFAIRPNAILLGVFDQRLDQRRGWRNWIPRHDVTPENTAPKRGG